MKKKLIPIFLVAICVLSFSACEKNKSVEPIAIKEKPVDISVKESAIKKFMSISFGVDTANIKYDKTAREYTLFGKFKLNRDTVEKSYDKANEYKAKYEPKSN
jgi:energy-converting hydrogenase Eha subunit H